VHVLNCISERYRIQNCFTQSLKPSRFFYFKLLLFKVTYCNKSVPWIILVHRTSVVKPLGKQPSSHCIFISYVILFLLKSSCQEAGVGKRGSAWPSATDREGYSRCHDLSERTGCP